VAPFRFTSRATVVWGRPIRREITLKLSPRARPREISSRSAATRQRSARSRGRGRTPPLAFKHFVTLVLNIPTSRAIAWIEFPCAHSSQTRSRRHFGHRPITTTFRTPGSQPGRPDSQVVQRLTETAT
jgi:hypothetical protein